MFFINVNYDFMNGKKYVVPLEPLPSQTDAHTISSILIDANEFEDENTARHLSSVS
jgi:hypothetical protein